VAIHIELKIVKGIGPQAGDTASAERQIEFINLLDSSGFSVEYDGVSGWTPNVPQMKNNGLFADSAIADGARLLAAPVGNVTENLRLRLVGSAAERAAQMRALGAMTDSAHNFWETFWQIEPVYIKWHASAGAGPQYALVYDIQIASRNDPFGLLPFEDVSLVIVREPYWRGLAPGDNPKKWTIEFQRATYTAADLDLSDSSTGNLASDTLENRREWNTTTTAEVSSNVLDIPAANIPGDAPALACVTLSLSSAEGLLPDRVYLARSTKPLGLTIRDGSGVETSQFNIFNAGDGSTGIDSTIVADANAPASNKSASGQRVTVSFATNTTMIDRVAWTGSGLEESSLDANTFRGRYAIFLRARLSATGTVHARIQATSNAGNDPVILPSQTIQLGVGATPSWYLHYMGILDIPFWQRSVVAANGLGLQITTRANSTINFRLSVQADRTSGTSSLFISDLILMPFDESFCFIDGLQGSRPILDNTGYFGHGLDEHVGGYFPNGIATIYNFINSLQLVGQSLTLVPGVSNRIYYLAMNSAKGSPIGMNSTIRVNLVTRWSGIRDT